jgi:hypothetical protein
MSLTGGFVLLLAIFVGVALGSLSTFALVRFTWKHASGHQATGEIRMIFAIAIGLVWVFVVSLCLTVVIGLGPEEFWIFPPIVAVPTALILRRRRGR